MDIKHIIKFHSSRNIPLTFDEAYELGMYALRGCRGNSLAQIQSIAALCALHTKATYGWVWNQEKESEHGERLPQSAAEQIAGICAAIFKHDIALSPSGFLKPNVPYAIDNSGMGGDLIVTANVSTIAGFIAASAGIPMCKHGSPANADKGLYGSSDFIALLGIDTFAPKNDVEACIEWNGFGFTEALDTQYKLIHLQTHAIAQLPHMNDIIGPITNPLHPSVLSRRVVGINHLVPPRVVAEAYKILNAKGVTNLQHGLFVRGFVDTSSDQGMDEVSICKGGTQVAELYNGTIREYHLSAQDFGLCPAPHRTISPPIGMNKGEFSVRILRGEISGPPLEMVLANAALLFYLANSVRNLKTCYSLAKDAYLSGGAYKTALAVKKSLPKKG